MNRKKLFVSNKDMPDEVKSEKVMGIHRLSNHLVPFYVYIPVVLLAIFCALFVVKTSFLTFAGYFLIAIPLWSGFEYFMHRFALHGKPKNPTLKKFLYSTHTAHHEYPNDNRFVLVGLDVSLVALFIFYGLSLLVLGAEAHSFMAGWVATYLFYDWLHYAVHNYNFNNKLYKIYQKHHIDHHFVDDTQNFGFISLLWDGLFNTKIDPKAKIKQRNKHKVSNKASKKIA